MAEQRYQAVMAVISDGLSISQVAEKVGVSRQTLHSWLARYEAAGLEGLVDRSHRPVSCPHQMSAVVEAALLELRRSRPYWGPRRLVFELAKRRIGPLPLRIGSLSGVGARRHDRPGGADGVRPVVEAFAGQVVAQLEDQIDCGLRQPGLVCGRRDRGPCLIDCVRGSA